MLPHNRLLLTALLLSLLVGSIIRHGVFKGLREVEFAAADKNKVTELLQHAYEQPIQLNLIGDRVRQMTLTLQRAAA